MIPLGVRRDLNWRSSRFKALPLSHVRTLWARHAFLWPGAWFLTCCLVAALPVTVYTERSRITIQRERLILSLASYQIVPLVVAFLPAYHPACIVNWLMSRVERSRSARLTVITPTQWRAAARLRFGFEAAGIELWVFFLFVHRSSVKVTNWKIVSLALLNEKRPGR